MKHWLILFGLIGAAALAAGANARQAASALLSHTPTARPTLTLNAPRRTPAATLTPAATSEAPASVVGDAERGEELFTHGANDAPPCITCHQRVPNAMGFALGPNLAGIAERAAERVEGLSADAYIIQSILHPHAFVVPGYRDIMYPSFAEHYDDQDIADLVAYLMTL